MERPVTARDLFDELQDRLQLEWICGPRGDDTPALSPLDLTERPAAAGFLNLIHPNRVQVVGGEESAYLAGLDADTLAATVEQMFAQRTLAILFGDADVASLSVSGVFRLDDPEATIAAVALSLDLDVKPVDEDTVLLLKAPR